MSETVVSRGSGGLIGFVPRVIDRSVDLYLGGFGTRLPMVIYQNLLDRPILLTIVLALDAPAPGDLAIGEVFGGPAIPPGMVRACSEQENGMAGAANTITKTKTMTCIIEAGEYYELFIVLGGTAAVTLLYWFETLL